MVDDHFGHCDHYTIYTIEDKTITATQTLPSPQGCGCKSNIASTLHDMGVEVMLAGNMGQGALNKLSAAGSGRRGAEERGADLWRSEATGSLLRESE